MQIFEISIIYDNLCKKPGFTEGFGFSALVLNRKTDTYLLFDTGGNGHILLHNLEQLSIKPKQITKIIISHDHHDHSGGLKAIYAHNQNLEIYVPYQNKHSFVRTYSKANVIGVSNLTKIEKNVFSSGQIGSLIKEQALYLETEKNEIVILVGCTHPGLEKFIVKARELGEIKAIIGGFHGFNNFSYLDNIELIGACHCTRHLELLKKQFPKQFHQVCVGSTFSF